MYFAITIAWSLSYGCRSIGILRKTHDLGSGYPSDSVTVKFVSKYYKKNHTVPVFVRKSWKPVQKIMGKN